MTRNPGGGRRRVTARRRRAQPSAVPVAVAAVVLIGLALGVGIWRRQAGTGNKGIDAGMSLMALLDSLGAAEARRDWVSGLVWAERLAAAKPRDADALRDLSVAVHNNATLERPSPTGPRPAMRNSVERAASEARAVALAESAAAVAVAPDEWTRAEFWRGNLMEFLGLPIDAWSTDRGIIGRVPDHRGARMRMLWLLTHLRDPQAPDRIQIDPDSLSSP